MPISFNSNSEIFSTANSSTANLAAGATFTGTADPVTEVDIINVYLFATQNCTLIIDQSTDSTNWDISDTFTTTANVGYSTTVASVAGFCRVRVTNNGVISTTSLRLGTQYSAGVSALPRKTGSANMANSVPVTISSDQTAVPSSQSGTWSNRITDGTDSVPVTTSGELRISDGLSNGGVYGALTLTTAGTTYEAKVGETRLSARKSLVVTALDDIYWGTDSSVTTSTGTPLYKNQQIVFSINQDSTFQVWLVAAVNSRTARIVETL